MITKTYITALVILFSLIVLIFIFGKNNPTGQIVRIKKVIIECAEVIPFDSLTKKQQDEVGYTSYYPNDNWRDIMEYDKKDAYFVKARINNKLLAELAKSDIFTVEKLLDSNPYSLYGKYSISWEFFDEDTIPINPTTKFSGHNIFEIKRFGHNDFLIVGPIPERPSKMEIHTLGESGRILSHKLLDKNCY